MKQMNDSMNENVVVWFWLQNCLVGRFASDTCWTKSGEYLTLVQDDGCCPGLGHSRFLGWGCICNAGHN